MAKQTQWKGRYLFSANSEIWAPPRLQIPQPSSKIISANWLLLSINTTRWPCSIRPHFQRITLSARSSLIPLTFVPLDARSRPPSKLGNPFGLIAAPTTPTCDWEPDIGGSNDGLLLELLAPTHISEIPLVFSQLTNLPLPNRTCSLDAQEIEISKVLVSAWTSMAATGTPGHGAGTRGGPWPQYNANESNGPLISNFSSVGYVNYMVC